MTEPPRPLRLFYSVLAEIFRRRIPNEKDLE